MDLNQYVEQVTSLEPTLAVSRWLDLFDRLSGLDPQQLERLSEGTRPPTMHKLMAALPGPESWDALTVAVEKRPAAKEGKEASELGLRLLVYTLVNNPEARKTVFGDLEKAATNANAAEKHMYQQAFEQIGQSVVAQAEDPDAVILMLNRELLKAEGEQYGPTQVSVPNVVAIAGPEKAETFLRRAMTAKNVTLQFSEGEVTKQLARKLALEMIDELETPQCSLAAARDSVELYEALEKKFTRKKAATDGTDHTETGLSDFEIPNIEVDDDDWKLASFYYMLGLIANSRIEDALLVAEEFKMPSYGRESAIREMQRAGNTDVLNDFFHDLLEKNPNLPYWDLYVQISASAEDTERMLELARAASHSDDLKASGRSRVHSMLSQALLAADKVEEGVAELRKLAALADDGHDYESQSQIAAAGRRIAKIGSLLRRDDWLEEGIALEKKRAESDASPLIHSMLASLLIENDRAAEAELMLADAIAKTLRQVERYDSLDSSHLHGLAEIYSLAGRHNDVVAIFDTAPWWGVRDLSETTQWDQNSVFYNPYSLGVLGTTSKGAALILAEALEAVGRGDEALKLINAIVDMAPANDHAYALLVKHLDAESAHKRLDEIFTRDQFEERPLIWKAYLLHRQGKNEEAEAIARQAISIDPSDGEQVPGDRMRVYSVLADIREARGDAKEASFFRGVVRAVRKSEEADRYRQAGLLNAAVRRYRDSLTHFSDASCIQARLALQLAEMGKHDEAEVHYRRAYELMPDSFGRVESHCFGCERAFDGERAQNFAEKIFVDIARENPEKPQVHYLLGYLRKQQERGLDSLPHFRRAVELDPDYLNAWVKISELGQSAHMSISQREEATLNILRLDPLRRHAYVRTEGFRNLKALWKACETSVQMEPAVATNLYRLDASVTYIEEKMKVGEDDIDAASFGEWTQSDSNRNSPSMTIMTNGFVRAAKTLMGGNSYYY